MAAGAPGQRLRPDAQPPQLAEQGICPVTCQILQIFKHGMENQLTSRLTRVGKGCGNLLQKQKQLRCCVADEEKLPHTSRRAGSCMASRGVQVAGLQCT